MGRSGLQAIGDRAESIALGHLTTAGLCLVTRNYRCRLGEIDLVMLDTDDCLVFVEVRYRQAGSRVDAIESIGPRKRRKLALAAARFIAQHRRFQQAVVRFDVVAIDGADANGAEIRWIADAFRP